MTIETLRETLAECFGETLAQKLAENIISYGELIGFPVQ